MENNVLAAERLNSIRRLLSEAGAMRIEDLCEKLHVSPATIRRDLTELDNMGAIMRVHGGAMPVRQVPDEAPFDDKANVEPDKKNKIAQKAIEYIRPTDSIYIDGGSTTHAIARLLAHMTRLTIITNSLRVATTLSSGGPRIVLIGGDYRRVSQSFVGALTGPQLDKFFVDTAFMGTTGVSIDGDLSTTDASEAFTKKIAITRAKRKILLVDSTKIGANSFALFGNVKDFDVVITNKNASGTVINKLKKLQVKMDLC